MLLRRTVVEGVSTLAEAVEFHTTVISGPLFKQDLKVRNGEVTSKGDYMYLTLELEN